MHSVYCLLDEDINPYYIGITNNIIRRKSEHQYYIRVGDQLPKYRKARKVGELIINNIITNVNLEDAKKLEEAYITFFKNEDYKLYNLTDGGDGRVGFVTSDITKQRISKAKKGTKWRHHTEETKKRMSEIRMGIIFSDEHKMNLKKARKGRVTKEETRIRLSKSCKGIINIKRFRLISPDGNVHITHEGLTKFCEKHNLTAQNLHKVLVGKRKHHKGWKIERYGK